MSASASKSELRWTSAADVAETRFCEAPRCDNEFRPKDADQRFCSDRCSRRPEFQVFEGRVTTVRQLRQLVLDADPERRVPAQELAVKIITDLQKAGRCQLLVPLLVEAIHEARRSEDRKVERQRPSAPAGPEETADGGWRRFLEGGFCTLDGRYVAWGRATVKDHENGLAWINGRLTQLARTAVRHRWAIKTIRERGVACLADIAEPLEIPDVQEIPV